MDLQQQERWLYSQTTEQLMNLCAEYHIDDTQFSGTQEYVNALLGVVQFQNPNAEYGSASPMRLGQQIQLSQRILLYLVFGADMYRGIQHTVELTCL